MSKHLWIVINFEKQLQNFNSTDFATMYVPVVFYTKLNEFKGEKMC